MRTRYSHRRAAPDSHLSPTIMRGIVGGENPYDERVRGWEVVIGDFWCQRLCVDLSHLMGVSFVNEISNILVSGFIGILFGIGVCNGTI